jgi:hypothetical protein
MDVASDNGTQWDVLPDGQHFIIRAATGLVGQPETVSPIQQIQIVLNWTEELKQRARSRSSPRPSQQDRASATTKSSCASVGP